MEDNAPDLNDMGRAKAESLRDRLKDGTLTPADARDELTQLWSNDVARPGMLLTSEEWRDLWLHAGHIHLYREIHGGPAQWKFIDRPSTKVRLDSTQQWHDGDTVWTAEFEPERLLATCDLHSTGNGETEYIAYPVGLDLEVHPDCDSPRVTRPRPDGSVA